MVLLKPTGLLLLLAASQAQHPPPPSPATARLFPIPHIATVADPTASRPLASAFQIIAPVSGINSSDVVTAAVARYMSIVPTCKPTSTGSGCAGTPITSLMILVADSSITMPDLDVDVSYTLRLDAGKGTATVSAQTPFGALYGIETFSQLVAADGTVAGDGIVIQDKPSFRHRGLTIDVGRRVAPVALVNSIIDGLGYTKVRGSGLGGWGRERAGPRAVL